MTNEELDEARAKEARNIWTELNSREMGYASVTVIAARLAREGWQPPPKVDADTLAAREWLAADTDFSEYATAVNAGREDHSREIRAFRAGLAHARASAPNADDVAELVYAARGAVLYTRGAEGTRIRKALAKFGDTRPQCG